MTNFIPVSEPLLMEMKKKYLLECIDTGWISSEGPYVKKFENEFAEKVWRKYGITVANGTVVLEIAAQVMGITKDDEVVMPSFTLFHVHRQLQKPALNDE